MRRVTEDMRLLYLQFGDERFVRSDLWRLFANRYLTAGGTDGWPKDDFIAWLALDGKPWIVDAPGPRGGEGWRLSNAALAACEREMEAFLSTRDTLLARASDVDVRLGSLLVLDGVGGARGFQFQWVYHPPVPISGSDVCGRRRPDRRDAFVFVAAASASLEDLQASVDKAEAHVRALAGEERQRLLEQVEVLAGF